MTYLDQKTAFHRPDVDEDALYQERFSSADAVHLGVPIAGNPGFFVMTPEIYKSVLRTTRADKELLRLIHTLPDKAIGQFAMNNLIDEIVLTNEIEGVRSTRREIADVLESLQRSDKKKRFSGLVKKYFLLNSGEWDAIEKPADIRHLYDELVLQEVLEERADNAPDGQLFRKEHVSVYDEADREIHRGLMPEQAIIEVMERSLQFLNDEDLADDITRIAAFHFLFGYIHPFYDGNGRTNRFISSQYLSNCCEPLAGYSLSYTIKEHLSEYNRAFVLGEHPLSRGDITPFVAMFCEVVADSLERVKRVLEEKKAALQLYEGMLADALAARNEVSERARALSYILIQAALFSECGLSVKQIGTEFGVSKATVYKLIQEVEGFMPIVKERRSREVLYSADLDAFAEEHA